MGNLVSELESQQPCSKLEFESSLIEDLRAATFGSVIEARQGFLEDHDPTKLRLNAEEFDMVLGPLLSDTEEGYKMFAVEDEAEDAGASVMEIFTAAFIFCSHATLDQKMEAIFTMFDIDGSGSMNPVEIEIMTEGALLGMAKAAKLRLPESKVVEEMANRLFVFLNKRLDGDMCQVHELKEFISMQEDILRFLAIFTDAHLITYSKREVERITRDTLASFLELASKQSGHSVDKPWLSPALAARVVHNMEGMHTPEEELQQILDIMTCQGRSKKVSVNAFKSVLQPWIAFDVLDRDSSGSLDRKELKALLWISKGLHTPEPTNHAVRAAMLDLDKNGDHTIDRMEWVVFNSKLMGAGTLTFADTLRLVFQEYDADGSGTITRAELQRLFLDLLQKSADTVADMRLLSKGSQDTIRGMFHNSINALLDDLDKSDKGEGELKRLQINWQDFKAHKKDIDAAVRRIEEFVRVLVEQDAVDDILVDESENSNNKSLAAILALSAYGQRGTPYPRP